MSEDDPDPDDVIEAEETPEEGDETPHEEGADPPDEGGSEDDIPALEDDEKAEIPGDLADKMRETRDDPPESPDEGDDEDPPETPEEGGSDTEDEGGSEGSEGGSESSSNEWGEVYVDTLAIFLLEISAELNESGETEMTEEEVRNLATSGPIDVSEAAGEVINQSGIGNEMTPAQSLVAGSAMMAFAVLMKETDAAGEMVGRVSEGLEGAEIGGEA